MNGFVAFSGALHVRGACASPAWHSLGLTRGLRDAYQLDGSDVLFGQDCVGDQFILRSSVVHKLYAETGELESLDQSLSAFLESACANPRDAFSNEPLLQVQAEGGRLAPGELLSISPPYCTVESARGVSVRPIAAADRLAFLVDFSGQIRAVPEGGKIMINPRE